MDTHDPRPSQLTHKTPISPMIPYPPVTQNALTSSLFPLYAFIHACRISGIDFHFRFFSLSVSVFGLPFYLCFFIFSFGIKEHSVSGVSGSSDGRVFVCLLLDLLTPGPGVEKGFFCFAASIQGMHKLHGQDPGLKVHHCCIGGDRSVDKVG
jgi:hypothetical protein